MSEQAGGDTGQPPNLDDLIDSNKKPPHEPPRTKPPRGWEPGARIAEDGVGEAVLPMPDPGEEPNWDQLLSEMGFGDVLQFVRVVEVRSWEVFSKHAHGKNRPGIRLQRYVKCKIVRRMEKADKEDMDLLKEQINSMPLGPTKKLLGASGSHNAIMLFLADWQFGKREGGGSRATVMRIHACMQKFLAYVEDLRRIGVHANKVIVCGMGDMVEACDGHYAMQTHQVDMHMRQQRMAVRRLLVMIARMLRPYFTVIEFRAVPGNHGEERKNGKAFTSFSDNNDVCIFDQFGDIVKEATWGDGVEVITTSVLEPQLTMSFDVKDTSGNSKRVGLAHGHQAGSHSRGDPAGKVKAWWTKCSGSRHPIGYCDILNTGHYHHFRCEDRGEGRTWFQCPTLDGGSFWFWSGGGSGSVPGMLTYVIQPASTRGWDHVRVLTP